MSKVPCGGFKLDENFLGMNENDELSLTGGSEGKAYQYLVTDGDGNTKWEDRLAYADSKLVVNFGDGGKAVQASDEVPSWVSMDAPMKVWVSDGTNDTATPEDYTDYGKGNGNFAIKGAVIFIMADNSKIYDKGYELMFPKKGVYFMYPPLAPYVMGISSVDSGTPEITWDGNIGTLKTIDPKFIPSELNEIILPSSTPSSTKKFKITVNDNGAITATEVTTNIV